MKKFLVIGIIVLFATEIKAQDSTLIGLSLPYLRDRWYSDVEYIEKNVNILGGKLLLEYAYGDIVTQKEQIKLLINNGAKVIIIVAVNAEGLSDEIKEAKDKGIKIIAYDRLIKDSDIDCYVSFDANEVGKLQANYVTSKVSSGNVVLLAGPKKDNNATEFLKGQKEGLEPFVQKGQINIIHEVQLQEWGRLDAFMEINNLMENNTKIDAVIASNDEIASGVIMACDDNEKYKNILLTGQDASIEGCKNIIAEKQAMTVYKPIKMLANKAVELAFKLANNEPIDIFNTEVNNGMKKVPALLLEPIVVDKLNLKDILISDGFYTHEQLFGE